MTINEAIDGVLATMGDDLDRWADALERPDKVRPETLRRLRDEMRSGAQTIREARKVRRPALVGPWDSGWTGTL